MAEKRPNAKKDILFRVRVLYAVFILAGLLIATRLVWVQMFSGSVARSAEVLSRNIFRTTEIPSHRGAILARGGEPLAASVFRYQATFDFAAEGFASAERFDKETDSLSACLARFFSREDAARHGYRYLSKRDYKKIFDDNYAAKNRKRSVKIFPREVTLDEWRMMRDRFPILNGNMGVTFGREQFDKRVYPYGDNLARQIIGRIKDTTAYGIEGICNEELTGRVGRTVQQQIANGFWARVNDADNIDPEDGCDIVTTIDAGLQQMADERMRRQLVAKHGSFGVAIVMEAATGDILAMVNLGAEGERRGERYTEYYNHAVRTSLTPGSTFKLTNTLILVEDAGFTASNSYDTEHSPQLRGGRSWRRVGGANVTDSHDAGKETDGIVNLVDAFAHSSNIYFAKAIYETYRNNPSRYVEQLRRLRIDECVGLQAFGEKPGHISDSYSDAFRLPRQGFGYEVTLPAIHTAAIFNAVANGGRMVSPRLVSSIRRGDEEGERKKANTLVERICSDRTLALVRECMVAASKQTKNIFSDVPVDFGCKTGTAHITGSFISNCRQDTRAIGVRDKYYLGSIGAYFPADRPKYTVFVCMCKESTGYNDYFGIDLAGPVAADIMKYIYTNDPSLHEGIEPAATPQAPRNIKGGNAWHTHRVAYHLSPDIEACYEGSEWCSVKVDEQGKATLGGVEVERGTVPDVRGMGLKDALYLLEYCGLDVSFSGRGRVVTQSLRAGTKLSNNRTKIRIILER